MVQVRAADDDHGRAARAVDQAIELDGVNETKRVALVYETPHWNVGTELRGKALSFDGVQFLRGEFVFALRVNEEKAHCGQHVEYNVECVACVDAEMKRRGVQACNHTTEEGCTGHGDF